MPKMGHPAALDSTDADSRLPISYASRASGCSEAETKISQLIDQLADEFHLTGEERLALNTASGQATFYNRVHWAKSYLTKAALIESTRRGFCKITERGADLLKSHPTAINIKLLMKYPEFQKFRERSIDTSTSASPEPVPVAEVEKQTPDEVMKIASHQIEAALAQDLLDRIVAAPPAFFEQVIVSLLLAMGYGGSRAEAGRVLGQSGDDGVDGVIDQDALGLDRVYVQAKRYKTSNSIGAGAIRDFFGSLDHHKAAKGLFVTTSHFSPSAKDTAKFLSKRIVLIDGEQLTDLMIRHSVGCRVEKILYIKRIDEDFFE